MKQGDLVKYSEDEYNDRLGTLGLILDVHEKDVAPPIVSILWETNELERVFSDELVVISESNA